MAVMALASPLCAFLSWGAILILVLVQEDIYSTVFTVMFYLFSALMIGAVAGGVSAAMRRVVDSLKIPVPLLRAVSVIGGWAIVMLAFLLPLSSDSSYSGFAPWFLVAAALAALITFLCVQYQGAWIPRSETDETR